MRKLLYLLGVVVGVAVLWFAYYAISPLFRNIVLDEALPQEQAAGSGQPERRASAAAAVVGTAGHPASGTVRIVETDTKTYVRYEDLKTINGPDLFIYLAKDLDAQEHVNLGVLRATEGNVNYEIPSGVDVSEYRYVLTWCKQFGVLFNYADIQDVM